MSDSWPDADVVADLFDRFCAGDRVALSDFIVAVLDPLAAHLRHKFHADEHDCNSAATDAVLDLIRNPAIYDPTRRGLIGFLRMSAEGDLINLREKERKHHANRKSSEYVELVGDGGNTSADDLPSFDDPHLAAEINSFDAAERAVFELMRAGERATAAFAAVLGITHLPEDEQAREVKQVKDRIKKRLQRTGGSHERT